jgi:hypothetical protein
MVTTEESRKLKSGMAIGVEKSGSTVPRFFWPPLMPRMRALPTMVLALATTALSSQDGTIRHSPLVQAKQLDHSVDLVVVEGFQLHNQKIVQRRACIARQQHLLGETRGIGAGLVHSECKSLTDGEQREMRVNLQNRSAVQLQTLETNQTWST